MSSERYTAPDIDFNNQPVGEPASRRESNLLASVLGVLRRGKRRILWTGLATFVLAAVVVSLMAPRYTATAVFIPPSGNGGAGMAAAMLGQLSSVGGGLGSSLLPGVKSSADSYVGILQSQSVAGQMVERFHLKDVYRVNKEVRAEKALASHTDVKIESKSNFISISVTDKDPVRARDMTNGYLDTLRTINNKLALTENSQRRLFYEDRLRREKDELANAEVDLKKNQESTGLIAPAGQTASQIQAVAQLRAQLGNREVQLASLRADETEENPNVMRMHSEIANLRAQIAQMENGKQGTGSGAISAAQVPGFELEYIRLAREVKYHETLFEIISKQYEAARLDEAQDQTLQLLDVARTPELRSGPPRLLVAAAGLVIGLLAGMLWELARATRRREIDWSQKAA